MKKCYYGHEMKDTGDGWYCPQCQWWVSKDIRDNLIKALDKKGEKDGGKAS